jgi:factor associated with neutral sphingomyelinase activation
MPLVSIKGLVHLTDQRVYMQPQHPKVLDKSAVNIKIKNIMELYKRRYTLMDLGMEIVSHKVSQENNEVIKKKTMYLVFNTKKERDTVFDSMLGLTKKCGNVIITTEDSVEKHTQKWCNGEITNFEYLMILNSYAQRSF